MASLGLGAVLIVALILICKQHMIEPLPVDARLRDIERHLSDTRAEFKDRIRKIFYDKVRGAEEQSNYPLLAMAADVASSEMLLFAYDQWCHRVAHEAIKYYFKDKREPLDAKGLMDNRDLMDLILYHHRQKSYTQVIDGIEMLRKRIYLLMTLYGDRADVVDLANDFFIKLDRYKLLRLRADVDMDDSLETYSSVVSGQLSPTRLSNTISNVDIITAEIAAQTNPVDGSNFWHRYVEPRWIEDINSEANRAADNIIALSYEEIEAVNLTGVRLHYEDHIFSP